MTDKHVLDTWERGSPYEQYVGRWSRRVAPQFLSWLDIPAGRSWLDVGCGTGALCAAIVDGCSPASVAGVEPSEEFRKTAKENLGGRVAVHQGSATMIPLGDASVDVVVSGLVLNFVPDPRAALEKLFDDAGLGGVEVAPIDISTPFANFDEYWQPFLGGQGPAPAYAMSLDENARTRLRVCLRERIPSTANGAISLTARAWAVHGTVAT